MDSDDPSTRWGRTPCGCWSLRNGCTNSPFSQDVPRRAGPAGNRPWTPTNLALVSRGTRPVPVEARGGAIHRLETPRGHFERRVEGLPLVIELMRSDLRDGCWFLTLRQTSASVTRNAPSRRKPEPPDQPSDAHAPLLQDAVPLCSLSGSCRSPSLLKSRRGDLGVSGQDLGQHDIHMPVPAGATRTDGPSAGVAMFAASASLFTGRPVRSHAAMTGEILLRELVRPVGGIKEKVLAALRAGITTALWPSRNGKEWEEAPVAAHQTLRIIGIGQVQGAIESATA